MLKIKKKLFSIILCFVLLFAPIVNTNYAHAQWYTFDAITGFFTGLTSSGTWAKLGIDIAKGIADSIAKLSFVAVKVGTLMGVQALTKATIGGAVISDYNNYLYTSPQQRAMTAMNSFFNTVSNGRLSSLNYEGIGPNYDSYLVAQARQSIGGQSFATNLQNQVSDPSQMFSTGNMKGIMSYMQCANNVMCYTMTATAQYNQEFTKAQDIARSESSNGFLPTKVKGRITRPAELAKSALLQIDQLGTQIIMNATTEGKEGLAGGLAQVFQGAVISYAAKVADYSISNKAERDAIRNQNAQFPFSLSYSTASGIGVSATNGGKNATTGTGVGAVNGSMTIGNTQANGALQVNPNGTAGVGITGTRVTQ